MSKGKSIILIIALLFLGFVGYTKFSLPLDSAEFNPDLIYRGGGAGNTNTLSDPKAYYNEINGWVGTNNTDDDCKVEVTYKSSPVEFGKGFYVFNDTAKDGAAFITTIEAGGSSLFKDGEKIWNPRARVVFANSNALDSKYWKDTAGKHNIELILDDQVIIVFKDIKTWWCHAHNPSQDAQHTEPVGKFTGSSTTEFQMGGTLLGIANATTTVHVYRLKEDVFTSGTTTSTADVETQFEEITSIASYFKDPESFDWK